jgi:hypothetical protein
MCISRELHVCDGRAGVRPKQARVNAEWHSVGDSAVVLKVY